MTMAEFINAMDKLYHFRQDTAKKRFDIEEFMDFDYFDDFEKIINGAYDSDASAYIIRNGEAAKLEVDSFDKVLLNKNSSIAWVLDVTDEEEKTGDVYKVDISGAKPGKAEKYDTEVHSDHLEVSSSDRLYYGKNVNNETYDLYVEKKLVEYDVSIVERTLKDGRILYYLDDDDNIGSYYCWKNGKKEKVSDDVYHGLLAVANRGVDSDENLLYCKNYDEDDEVWDLYVYKGNKEVKVGYDVSLMFTVDKSEKYHDVLSMSTVRSWFD